MQLINSLKDKSQEDKPSHGLSIEWFSDCKDEEEKQKFAELIRNSTRILKRLKNILEEHERTVLNTELSEQDFETSSWSFKQAYRNGQRSEINKMKGLVKFI